MCDFALWRVEAHYGLVRKKRAMPSFWGMSPFQGLFAECNLSELFTLFNLSN